MTFSKNKIQYVVVLLVGLVFLPIFVARAENINNFSSQITVNTDATVLVKETIAYDFGSAFKHGIYRDINSKGLTINPIGVSFNGLTGYPYTTSKGINNFNFKIGSANETVSGLNTYDISYLLKGTIRYFSDQDQLYFNVTGNGWTVPITKASATIILPSGIAQENIQVKCYTGVLNSKDMNCSSKINADGSITFETSQLLNSGEGLTVVVGWPKGIVKQTVNIISSTPIINYIVLGVGILLFIATIVEGFTNWFQYGRDAKTNPVIVTQYEPPNNCTPAEMLYLMYPMGYETFLSKALGATLIDLAYNGYLNVKELPKSWWQKQDYLITEADQTKTKRRSKKVFEEYFLDYLFNSVSQSENSPRQVKLSLVGKDNSNSKFVPEFKEKITDSDLIKQDFEVLPKEVNKISNVPLTLFGITIGYWVILSLLLFTSFGLMFQLLQPVVVTLILGLVLYMQLMIKRNSKGLEGYEKCLGFKKYLTVAEKDILSFQAKVKELDYKSIYEKYLSYAIALGVVKEWSNAFKGLITDSFDWWQTNNGVYNYVAFSNSLNMFSINLSQNSASSGFSSGGGFSGGGSGGGGGGSW
ncbi:MAG TPA: DUF2207 domain-containing protein [Candidatus Paceibacterota bacterium]|nr:DUF2207 domain-containing protein [Candidatus Paceibacterota bacterium]